MAHRFRRLPRFLGDELPLSASEYANGGIGELAYDVHMLSETGDLIRTSVCVSVAAEFDANFATLIFGGGATRLIACSAESTGMTLS